MTPTPDPTPLGEDISMSDRGLFWKYNVARTDGLAIHWCFVLEGDDPLAIPALQAYAAAARGVGKVALADDLDAQILHLAKMRAAHRRIDELADRTYP